MRVETVWGQEGTWGKFLHSSHAFSFSQCWRQKTGLGRPHAWPGMATSTFLEQGFAFFTLMSTPPACEPPSFCKLLVYGLFQARGFSTLQTAKTFNIARIFLWLSDKTRVLFQTPSLTHGLTSGQSMYLFYLFNSLTYLLPEKIKVDVNFYSHWQL